jgi:hypothetical protein
VIDGFTSLLVKSEGGECEEIIEEENGILISAMLRQYFMGLLTVGKWKNLAQHWVNVAERCETPMSPVKTSFNVDFPSLTSLAQKLPEEEKTEKPAAKDPWGRFLKRRFSINVRPHNENDGDEEVEEEKEKEEEPEEEEHEDPAAVRLDFEILIMRKYWAKWVLKAGVKASVCDPLDITVDWTRCIAPVTEGRIIMVGA